MCEKIFPGCTTSATTFFSSGREIFSDFSEKNFALNSSQGGRKMVHDFASRGKIFRVEKMRLMGEK